MARRKELPRLSDSEVAVLQGNKLCDSYMLTCRCGFMGPIDKWDGLGACDGSVLCPKCSRMVDVETGKEAEYCGTCEFCATADVQAAGD